MKLLLDTQAFIWLINNDQRLGESTLRTLHDLSNQIYVSYFSFFEMTIKASIGKLNYDPTILEDLPKMGIELILPTIDALQCYKVIHPDNKDPFDNMLIAVNRTEKTTFVTSDRKILNLATHKLKLLDATK